MLLWVLWVVHAMMSFWLVLVAITLPLAIGVTRRAVEHLLRPPGSTETAEGPPSVLTICLERGIRVLLIFGAVAVLAWGWGVDLAHLHGQDTWLGRLADGVLSAVVILLVADLLWHAMKTAIDRKLAETRRSRPAEHRRGAATGAAAHLAADLSQYAVRRRHRICGGDGARRRWASRSGR